MPTTLSELKKRLERKIETKIKPDSGPGACQDLGGLGGGLVTLNRKLSINQPDLLDRTYSTVIKDYPDDTDRPDDDSPATVEQHQPNEGSNSPDIWGLVIKDMLDRNSFGTKKYGTPLRANNGRNPLVDAYQEALDLCVYLRQAIYEESQRT
jgi:hypothetical protein